MIKKMTFILLCMMILTGCSTKIEKAGETQNNDNKTVKNTEATPVIESETDEFTEEELMENAPAQDKDGMPYIHKPKYPVKYEGDEPELSNLWDIYNLLDSTIILTVDDMKGAKTFIDGDVYSFIDKDGLNSWPATLPVGDKRPSLAHLYMSKNDITENLKKDDVIILEAVFHCPGGAMQKIVRSDMKGDVVHIITKAPQPDELWGETPLKE